MAASTLVIQSHRQPLPAKWLEPCLQSVQKWAHQNQYDYQFVDDELFSILPTDLFQRINHSKIIASDLARLRFMQDQLRLRYHSVIWCDADMLIWNPAALQLPNEDYALGREIWVQRDRKGLRAYSKVHNAFMLFRRENPFLDLYADTAEKLLRKNTGNVPPQFIGPKLLTALHNIVQCPVMEQVGVFSPLVIEDLLQGGGDALQLMLNKSTQPPVAANLCHSSVERGQINDLQMEKLISLLFRQGIQSSC